VTPVQLLEELSKSNQELIARVHAYHNKGLFYTFGSWIGEYYYYRHVEILIQEVVVLLYYYS
jgi:hypothetical protein